MKKKLIWTFAGLWLVAPLLMAQTKENPSELSKAIKLQIGAGSSTPSALDGKLFYQLLVGEITAQAGESGAGYALILDAARKTGDAQLFQRATEIALQSRSGEAALQAAQAWKQDLPTAVEPNRYVLQILIALNRISDTLAPLKKGIELTPTEVRSLAIAAIPEAYARVNDKKLALSVVEAALSSYLINPKTAGSAWTAVGRMRIAAGDATGALDAAQKGQLMDPSAEGPVLVALELMAPQLPGAEAVISKYYKNNVNFAPEIRLSYARALLDDQRYAEAAAQLQIVIREKPEFASAWLVLGSLQLQDGQLAQAKTSLERYVALNIKQLAQQQVSSDEPNQGLTQAYLALAQISEKRKDYAGANAWINKIENSEDMILVQSRRASLLASQGKLAEGRQLIRNLPERNPEDARLKMMSEVGLLRDMKHYQLAFDFLAETIAKSPDEADLIYDQAMMAEKLEKIPEMERLLRQVIALKPASHNAYNALGYSLADRNVRLPEAKQLIQKALEFVPNDPFIRDSLGWVEYRLGNQAEATKIFAEAFKAKPDAEIAAHFGEVLWSLGERDKALAVWREGQLLNPENETLLETLNRLRVKL